MNPSPTPFYFPYSKTAKKIKNIYNLHRLTYCVYSIQLSFHCHSFLEGGVSPPDVPES